MGDHTARARAIACKGAVHHCEDTAVDFLLDHEEIDEGFVNDRMRPVTALVEQAAKGIFHGACGGGKDVGFDGGKMDDVFTEKAFGNVKAFGIDFVQAEKFFGEIADCVAYVDPFFAFVEMYIFQAVRVNDGEVFVFFFAQMRVNDHGSVVAAVNEVGIVTIAFHGADNTIELPRRCGTSGKKKVP